MNDLKEIGGFIVSADPFVQHDNSLSGNGTVNSPLGVVPGYNETVLWTQNGSFNGPGKTLTFSEPASAFEKLEFRCGVDVQSKECITLEYHPGNAVVSWHEYYDGKFRQFYSLLNINDTGATAVSGCPYFANLAQNATFSGHTVNWSWCFQAITAIRGINRKQ